jgi:hypothetical protein
MIIHDLEFFNYCDQQHQKSDVATITGGVSASSSISASDGAAGEYITALVETDGDDSYSIAIIGDKVIKKRGEKYANYIGKYSASYVAGYDGVSYSFTVD